MDNTDSSIQRLPCLSKADAEAKVASLIGDWQAFLEGAGLDWANETEYYIDNDAINEWVRRVDKRIQYYILSHGLTHVDEYKQVAVQVYFLIKLRPFVMLNPNIKEHSSVVERFALYLIMAAVRSAHAEKYKGKEEPEFKYPCKERIEDIVYSFRFCDISREAMILFTETFADIYGVGHNFIMLRNRDKDIG